MCICRKLSKCGFVKNPPVMLRADGVWLNRNSVENPDCAVKSGRKSYPDGVNKHDVEPQFAVTSYLQYKQYGRGQIYKYHCQCRKYLTQSKKRQAPHNVKHSVYCRRNENRFLPFVFVGDVAQRNERQKIYNAPHNGKKIVRRPLRGVVERSVPLLSDIGKYTSRNGYGYYRQCRQYTFCTVFHFDCSFCCKLYSAYSVYVVFVGICFTMSLSLCFRVGKTSALHLLVRAFAGVLIPLFHCFQLCCIAIFKTSQMFKNFRSPRMSSGSFIRSFVLPILSIGNASSFINGKPDIFR